VRPFRANRQAQLMAQEEEGDDEGGGGGVVVAVVCGVAAALVAAAAFAWWWFRLRGHSGQGGLGVVRGGNQGSNSQIRHAAAHGVRDSPAMGGFAMFTRVPVFES